MAKIQLSQEKQKLHLPTDSRLRRARVRKYAGVLIILSWFVGSYLLNAYAYGEKGWGWEFLRFTTANEKQAHQTLLKGKKISEDYLSQGECLISDVYSYKKKNLVTEDLTCVAPNLMLAERLMLVGEFNPDFCERLENEEEANECASFVTDVQIEDFREACKNLYGPFADIPTEQELERWLGRLSIQVQPQYAEWTSTPDPQVGYWSKDNFKVFFKEGQEKLQEKYGDFFDDGDYYPWLAARCKVSLPQNWKEILSQ